MTDVLGQTLEDALEILTQEGAEWDILFTAPPKGDPPAGDDRVVRQDERDGRYLLTVCRVPDPFRS